MAEWRRIRSESKQRSGDFGPRFTFRGAGIPKRDIKNKSDIGSGSPRSFGANGIIIIIIDSSVNLIIRSHINASIIANIHVVNVAVLAR